MTSVSVFLKSRSRSTRAASTFLAITLTLFFSTQAMAAVPYDTKKKARQVETNFELCNEAMERGILLQEIKDGWAAKFWHDRKLFIIAPRQDKFYCAAFAYE